LLNGQNSTDWPSAETLSKEFESIGFYMSDHPLKNYEDILKQYNAKSFIDFEKSKNPESFIAGTVMSVKEKKQRKGLHLLSLSLAI